MPPHNISSLKLDDLPDNVILKIFGYVLQQRLSSSLPLSSNLNDGLYKNMQSAVALSRVSQRLYNFWNAQKNTNTFKKLFAKNYNAKEGTELEYGYCQKIISNAPNQEAQVFKEAHAKEAHTDEVWHVSYSNDGEHFVTVSKDCFVKVWTAKHPCELIFSHDLKNVLASQEYLVFSQFSPDDKLLAVCGKLKTHITHGKIAIFDVERTEGPEGRTFKFRALIDSSPYDGYLSWFDNDFLISVKTRALHNGSFDSVASIICTNARDYIMRPKQLFTFYNRNASAIRTICLSSGVSDSMLRLSEYVRNKKLQRPIESPNHLELGLSTNNPKRLRSSDGKVLVFTTGDRCFIPSQLGLKVVRKNDVLNAQPAVPDNDPIPPGPYDVPDLIVPLDGQIIGTIVCNDQQRVLINVRPWKKEENGEIKPIEDVLEAPPIQMQIELRIFSLVTLEFEPRVYTGHIGYTDPGSCFLMFLSFSEQFYSSGSEDRKAYIWERDHGCVVAELPHENVVSAAVFNPVDPEMLVTVSDDHSVTVFRSRAVMKLIKKQQLEQQQKQQYQLAKQNFLSNSQHNSSPAQDSSISFNY